jgi:hypothetical protein
MPTTVTCPKCRATQLVADGLTVLTLTCRTCGHQIPLDSDEPLDALPADPQSSPPPPPRSPKRSPAQPPKRQPARRGGGMWLLLVVLGIPALLFLGCGGVGYWISGGFQPLYVSSARIGGLGSSMEAEVGYNFWIGGPTSGHTYVLMMKSAQGNTYFARFPSGDLKSSGTLRASGFGSIMDNGPFEVWIETGQPNKRISNTVTVWGRSAMLGGPHGPVGPIGPIGPRFEPPQPPEPVGPLGPRR